MVLGTPRRKDTLIFKRYLLGLTALLAGAVAIYTFAIAPAIRDAKANAATYTVTRVIDGDTIEVRHGSSPSLERVRLAGIDTPERGQCGAPEATLRLTKLIAQDPQGLVILSTTGPDTNDRDRYSRLIRYVTVANGQDAGLTLIQDGYAIARYDSRDGYPHHDRESQYVEADDQSPPAVAC